MAITTHAAASPSLKFPSFMSFNFDPILGPNLSVWWIKPYREWGIEEEAIKNVFRNTFIGSIAGGSAGVAWNYLGLDKVFNSITTVRDCLATGCIIGGVIGAMRGVYVTRRFFLERPIVVEATHQSSLKAKKIINAFISSIDNPNILCPITEEFIVFPAKTHCSHVFEYFNIINWINRGGTTCPLCREPLQIRDLTYDHDTERKIQEQASALFNKMETILQRFPKRFFGLDTLPHLSDTAQITDLTQKLKQGEDLLKGSVEEIARKIHQPETLSQEEAFALAYFLIHQMKPLKEKIDQAFKIAVEHLTNLYTKTIIDHATYLNQNRQLNDWYSKFNIIPQECVILNKLYRL